VVKIEGGVGPSSIDRLNRQRQVTLTANVKPGGSQAEVISRMNQFVKEMKLESLLVFGQTIALVAGMLPLVISRGPGSGTKRICWNGRCGGEWTVAGGRCERSCANVSPRR
jgi:multidrug efflux pump subunit AcrB